jgi:hypothetical protein
MNYFHYNYVVYYNTRMLEECDQDTKIIFEDIIKKI